ncbi:UNVERIFIED_CONTAM: two-component system sensor histidine kinase DegS [Acetivibrio alkalicellulosi]
MISENVFLLCSSDTSKYDTFLSLLKNNFPKTSICLHKDDFISKIKNHVSMCVDSNFCIVFVEYSFLSDIYISLESIFVKKDYILISFSYKNQSSLADYANLFEFVDINSYNIDFFFKKLNSEISNRNKISSLNHQLKEFYEIGKSLSSEKDAIKLLDMIVTSSINLTSSDAGTIYLVIDKHSFGWTSIKNNDFDDKILKFIIAKNTSIDINLETYTSPITKESLFGYSVITGKPLRIDDAYNIDAKYPYKHNNSFDIHTGYITRSILTIPMKGHENNVLGVIQLINKKKIQDKKIDSTNKNSLDNIIPFDLDDEIIMNSLAGQAAVVLENNLLFSNMKNLLEGYKKQNIELEVLSKKILKAHEEERKRIAREIHDGAAQSVVNLSLKVDLIKKYFQNSMFENAMEQLNLLNFSIKSTSKEIRTILYDLKPSYLEEGLISALENKFVIFENDTGIKVDFTVTGTPPKMEYYLSSNMYRMVQETLSNIYKHANANNVIVNFSVDSTNIYITIKDDGIGFNTKEQSEKIANLKGGYGIRSLKERAELIKGKVDIQSEKGKGTSVLIYIPISQ